MIDQGGTKEQGKRGHLVIAGSVFVSLLLVISVYLIWKREKPAAIEAQEATSSTSQVLDAPSATSSASSQKMPFNLDLSRRLIAVMIDNHPAARPAASLADAGLVYEAEAEGGITRYMAIYDDSLALEEVGPIRSARPYFVDWAAEYDAVYVHVGGSPDALAKIISDKVADINEFSYGSFFWRGSQHSAPHNVYTSMENILKIADRKFEARQWRKRDPLHYDESVSVSASSTCQINISYPLSDVSWDYSTTSHSFIRGLDGKKHLDQGAKGIESENIILQSVASRVLDEKKRLALDHIGKGKALLCRSAACFKGTWAKNNKRSPTIFKLESGEEFTLSKGRTWVQIISSGTSYTTNCQPKTTE